jgi:Cu+-exporting ATPase
MRPGQPRDPVCGMSVRRDSPHRLTRGAVDYFFCSERCLVTFRADSAPRNGTGPSESRQKTPASDAEYTCPMHPDIVRNERGSCPICGMALEPRT